MKRALIILCLGSWLLALGSDPIYTDDSYYWPVVDTIVPATPVYDKNAREFIFLEDTTQHPDTVVMVIKN
ncbi:MAG: hypothetical protein IKY87_03915 [Paludibacteraceae bacterium]|nr:hypothetical protein [Paludibacteraceae bacterium]